MCRDCITKLLQNSMIRYCMVGGVNTLVGFGTMSFLAFIGFSSVIAYTLGTIAGVINSYFLNKKFTFKSQNSHKQDFTRFIIAMGISYLCGLAVVYVCEKILLLNPYMSFVCSSVVYTGVGYVMSRFWAFAQKSR